MSGPPNEAVAAVVLARMDSSRLPGKVLRRVGATTLLDQVADRVSRSDRVGRIVVATSDRAVDEPIARWGAARGLAVHRGDLHDVAGRFLEAADLLGATWAVRVNADSPFVDGALLSEAVALASPERDLVTNLSPRSYPYGVAAEVVRVEALRRHRTGFTAEEREHVTQGLYRLLPPSRVVAVPPARHDLSRTRLVVDTADDLEMFEHALDRLGARATTAPYDEVADLVHVLGGTS